MAQVRKAALYLPLALARDDQPAVVPDGQRRQVALRPLVVRLLLCASLCPELLFKQLDGIVVPFRCRRTDSPHSRGRS